MVNEENLPPNFPVQKHNVNIFWTFNSSFNKLIENFRLPHDLIIARLNAYGITMHVMVYWLHYRHF